MRSKIILSMLLLTLISVSFVSALDLRTPVSSLCSDYGDFTSITLSYSFGTFTFCYDNYGNECELPRLASGECELKDDWTQIDDYWINKSGLDNFDKWTHNCNRDVDCSIYNPTGKCHGTDSVNKFGVQYYDWWKGVYALGQYYCTMWIEPIGIPKCVNHRCVEVFE